MTFGVQDVLVTAMALGAVAIVVQRLLGVIRPVKSTKPGCASCASGNAPCADDKRSPHTGNEAVPVAFVNRR